MKRAIASLGLALSMAVCGIAGAQAQSDDYPSRTITFLCPFPAGGGTDILTRMLAQELQDKLKRPVIVENRPGAGTQLAAGAAAKSAPDGYTLLLAPITTLAIGPSVFKTLPYDTVKDFAPVGLVGSAQFALVANPSLGVDKLPELIALIKSKNGQMSYATSGASTPHHLFMEMFLQVDRRERAARALSRQRAGADRRDLRPGADDDGRPRGGAAADPGRQGEGLWRDLAGAGQGRAGDPDHRGGRAAGLCGDRLVLGGGARRHAAADRSTSSTAS